MNYLKVYECKKFRQPTGECLYYIEDTPENISAFVVTRPYDKDYAFVTSSDEIKLFSMGQFLDLVPDIQYLEQELLPCIIPMQKDECEIPEVVYYTEEQIMGMIPQMQEVR